MFRKKKVITVPLSGDIDITNILPLVDSNFFQRLRRVKQLGTVDYVFPGANHTRFEHSLGAFQRQFIQNQRWIREQIGLDKDTLRALEVFALLHDIGHPAFSHITEYLLSVKHGEFNNLLANELKSRIEKCDVDFNKVKSLFEKDSRLRGIVHDKNLGTEKLDYLERDAYYTGYGGKPEINRIFSYIYWSESKGLVLDFKAAQEIKHLQRAYMLMYKRVYLRKSCLIIQRLIQKAVHELLKDFPDQEFMYRIDDYDLIARLRSSKNDIIQRALEIINSRKLPKRFLSLRAHNFKQRERIHGKNIEVFGVNKEKLTVLIDRLDSEKLIGLEKKISKRLNIPYTDILVVPSQGGFRFVPKDIVLFDGDKCFSMKNEYPDHFLSMRADGESFLCLRVCVVGDRKVAFKKAGEIKELILNGLELNY